MTYSFKEEVTSSSSSNSKGAGAGAGNGTGTGTESTAGVVETTVKKSQVVKSSTTGQQDKKTASSGPDQVDSSLNNVVVDIGNQMIPDCIDLLASSKKEKAKKSVRLAEGNQSSTQQVASGSSSQFYSYNASSSSKKQVVASSSGSAMVADSTVDYSRISKRQIGAATATLNQKQLDSPICNFAVFHSFDSMLYDHIWCLFLSFEHVDVLGSRRLSETQRAHYSGIGGTLVQRGFASPSDVQHREASQFPVVRGFASVPTWIAGCATCLQHQSPSRPTVQLSTSSGSSRFCRRLLSVGNHLQRSVAPRIVVQFTQTCRLSETRLTLSATWDRAHLQHGSAQGSSARRLQFHSPSSLSEILQRQADWAASEHCLQRAGSSIGQVQYTRASRFSWFQGQQTTCCRRGQHEHRDSERRFAIVHSSRTSDAHLQRDGKNSIEHQVFLVFWF